LDSLNVEMVRNLIAESIAVKQRLVDEEAMLQRIVAVAEKCVDAFRSGNKVLLAGNGGSAADAQHIAAEIVSRFEVDRPGLPAIALNTDTSMLTAIGNDYGYEKIFQRQLEANGVKGDIFVGISTSGNSQNVVNALLKAREMNILAVGLSGVDGGKMASACDICICIPSTSTPRIQESHITVGHIICAMVEQALFEQYR